MLEKVMLSLKEELKTIKQEIEENRYFTSTDDIDGIMYGVILNNKTYFTLLANNSTLFPTIDFNDICFIYKKRNVDKHKDRKKSCNSDTGDSNIDVDFESYLKLYKASGNKLVVKRSVSEYLRNIKAGIEYLLNEKYWEKNIEDDYDWENEFYIYGQNHSCWNISIYSKYFTLDPQTNEKDIKKILKHIEDISYVMKDSTWDTVVGDIDEFCDSLNRQDITSMNYVHLAEEFCGCFNVDLIKARL
jgi:hypothetical protein